MSELKAITCRAALLKEYHQPQVIENVIIDAPGHDQVRLRMIAAGICASDGHIAWGHSQVGTPLPIVLGHEGLATVESVGEGVTELAIGDLVLANIMPQCGNCEDCQSGRTNFCAVDGIQTRDGPNKRLVDGTAVYGFCRLGVYSEYLLLKKNQVVKIDPRLNQPNVCILSCAVPTGFFAATHQAQVTSGSTCAIWGLGAIGLNAVIGCKHNGAKHIIGVDINSAKREKAFEFGCTEFINPNELDVPVEKYLLKKYGGLHYAFECIGSEAVAGTAYKSLKAYGTLGLVGVHDTAQISVPLMSILCGRKIVGGLLGGKRTYDGFRELAEMVLNGRYDIDRLVTHRFKLEQINEAFQTLKEGRCIRAIIEFN